MLHSGSSASVEDPPGRRGSAPDSDLDDDDDDSQQGATRVPRPKSRDRVHGKRPDSVHSSRLERTLQTELDANTPWEEPRAFLVRPARCICTCSS